MHGVTYLQTMLLPLAKDTSGAVATEYAFLIAFVSIVAAFGMLILGDNMGAFFNDIGEALQGAGDNIPDPFS